MIREKSYQKQRKVLPLRARKNRGTVKFVIVNMILRSSSMHIWTQQFTKKNKRELERNQKTKQSKDQKKAPNQKPSNQDLQSSSSNKLKPSSIKKQDDIIPLDHEDTNNNNQLFSNTMTPTTSTTTPATSSTINGERSEVTIISIKDGQNNTAPTNNNETFFDLGSDSEGEEVEESQEMEEEAPKLVKGSKTPFLLVQTPENGYIPKKSNDDDDDETNKTKKKTKFQKSTVPIKKTNEKENKQKKEKPNTEKNEENGNKQVNKKKEKRD